MPTPSTPAILRSTPAIIHRADQMSAGQACYWTCLSRKTRADVVDPHRCSLRDLRAVYPSGTRVYRASTGGKWGKSAVIVTL